MRADQAWIKRNLGFDPIKRPAPSNTVAFAQSATSTKPEDFRREIIDFNSEASEGQAFMAFSTATGLARFTDIPWPSGLAPQTGPAPQGNARSPLPKADVLVVTWTVDEGHALSRVLTPGKDSHDDYRPYASNFETISKKMQQGCPALSLGRLGTYWTTTIGNKNVVVFKSDSHMSQDGPELPNVDVWTQIIKEVQPKLVLTTGTAGGIGAEFQVGDVVVSPIVRFDCTSKFKNAPFHDGHYASKACNNKFFSKAGQLFKANADQLPKDNKRAPKITRVAPTDVKSSVLTTDFFGFDTSNNHFGLRGLGDVAEMGDAVLGLAASQMGASAPRWLAVRNVSDPQIKADGLTLKQQADMAGTIYKGYGRWSTVNSAIVCWALIAAE
jgi:nucleoside phosphorylase